MTRYVFDSYAMLSWYQAEIDALRVRRLILDPRNQIWMTVINAGEVYYRIAKVSGEEPALDALAWLQQLPITMIDADWRLAVAAAHMKGAYPLSYADCFAAALSRQLGARVVTGDPEFRILERARIVEVEWLTPKRGSRS